MIKNKFRLLPKVFCIATNILLLAACSKTPAPPAADEPEVAGNIISFRANLATAQRLLTAPVVPAKEYEFSLPGRIVWDEDHTSRITPPLAGRIEGTVVQPGSLVTRNQPLAHLSSPDLGSAQTESARAQAQLAQAERSMTRAKDLLAVNGIAVKDYEQAQLDLESSRAEAERTNLRLKSLGAGNSVDQRYTVSSPIPGVVVERNTNPGMEWRPDQSGTPLFVISDPSYLWCWIDAPESVLNMLHPGMNVMLLASAWPQQRFKARIDFVGDSLDPATRTIKVRARLRDPGRQLKAEMYVTASLTGKAQGNLNVPAKAVFLNNDGQQVFVKTAEGRFTRKTIVPVSRNEQWVSISRGLNNGDEVVVDGALYLQKLLDDNQQPIAAPSSATPPANASAK